MLHQVESWLILKFSVKIGQNLHANMEGFCGVGNIHESLSHLRSKRKSLVYVYLIPIIPVPQLNTYQFIFKCNLTRKRGGRQV